MGGAQHRDRARGRQPARWDSQLRTLPRSPKPPLHIAARLCILPSARVTPAGEGDGRTHLRIFARGPPLPSGHLMEGGTNRGTGRVYNDQAPAPPWDSSQLWRLPCPAPRPHRVPRPLSSPAAVPCAALAPAPANQPTSGAHCVAGGRPLGHSVPRSPPLLKTIMPVPASWSSYGSHK